MDWQHPVFQEMLQMGCSDSTRVMFAFQSYMKLCEVDVLFDVSYAYDEQLDTIYLTSKDGNRREQTTVHLPVPETRLSPHWLHEAQTRLHQVVPNAMINVLLKTPDTTILPYKICQGLCPPDDPELTKSKKAQQEKKIIIQTELNKRKADLYKEAKRKATTKSEQMDFKTDTTGKTEEL